MKITKKQKYIISAIVGGGILVTIAIVVPFIINSAKKDEKIFDLTKIKNQMQIASKSTTTLENTKVAIIKMYQNGTKKQLSSQAKISAKALAQYVYEKKKTKVFAFKLGHDKRGNQLLLLTISGKESNEAKSVVKSMHQLKWVRDALAKVEFGILFQIYQKRLSSYETLDGTKIANAKIKATDFQREKTPQEKLLDQAQIKINQVILNLTAKQLNIHGDSTRKPSEVGTSSTQIVLAIQKIITNNADINNIATKLIKAKDIAIEENDVTGTITITISNHGDNKMIAIAGFKATGTALEIAQAKIDNVKNGAATPTKKNYVNFGTTPLAEDVNVPSKDGITFSFIAATTVNDDGKATFTYEVDTNPQVDGTTTKEVSFVVSGFETQAHVNARLVQKVIQKLVAEDFTSEIDQTKIASVGNPSEANVIIDIKKKIGNTNARALVLPSDIIIRTNNIAKTVTIVINNHGPSKTIIISGFASIKDSLDQILAAIPNLGGPLIIPEGITSDQFDTYVQAMGFVYDDEGEVKLNIFRESDTSPMTKFSKEYQTKITSITFPNSFITIRNWFNEFEKLTTLTLGEKLQTIEKNAFFYTKLTSLIIPNAVTSIGSSAFKNSPLISLKLGNKLQTIGFDAFRYARLTSLSIPNAITSIGAEAFQNSPLTSLILGNKLQTIEWNAFYSAQLQDLTIPNTVTSIGSEAFRNSPLISLALSNQLQIIGGGAFANAKLTSLIIPNAVTSIGSEAFKNSPLTSLALSNQLQIIGGGAFANAKLTSLIIPNAVTSIGNQAFRNSPLTTLTLGNKLQTIDDLAFENAQLTSLTIPNSVTTIFVGAFKNSPLTTLTLGNKLKEIYMEAFFNAKLTSLTIPNSITRIGEMAFRNSPIPTITIFNNVGAHNAFKSSTTISRIKRPT